MKLAAIALLLAAPQPASVSPPSCVSQADVVEMALYFLPPVYRAVADKCRSTLSADSYLLTGGTVYFERLSAERDAHWPGARRAFMTIIGERELPKGLTDDLLRGMSDAVLTAKLTEDIKREHCATVDEYAELLAPLPPENLAKLVALTGALATKGDKKGKGGLPICAETLR